MALSYGFAHAAGLVKSTGNWAEFGFVPGGGRYNPHEQILNTTNVSALKVLWSAPDSSDAFTAPAFADGIMYTGSGAFEAATGEPLWSTTGDSISPAVSKGTAYIDTRNGLCAYTADSGTNFWCAGSSNYPPLAPSGAAVADGIACYGTTSAASLRSTPLPVCSSGRRRSAAAILLRRLVANGVVYHQR